MNPIQTFEGDGIDPDETGEWDKIDLVAIEYQHRLDVIEPAAWAGVAESFKKVGSDFDETFRTIASIRMSHDDERDTLDKADALVAQSIESAMTDLRCHVKDVRAEAARLRIAAMKKHRL